MAIYRGFSTQGAYLQRSFNDPRGVTDDTGRLTPTSNIYTKTKFKLTDEQLVLQDFVNALNIPQGSKTGRPGYGTTIWSLIFEPNTTTLEDQVEYEIRRVAEEDPRLIVNAVSVSGVENGIIAEIELAVSPMNQAQFLNIIFDRNAGIAVAA